MTVGTKIKATREIRGFRRENNSKISFTVPSGTNGTVIAVNDPTTHLWAMQVEFDGIGLIGVDNTEVTQGNGTESLTFEIGNREIASLVNESLCKHGVRFATTFTTYAVIFEFESLGSIKRSKENMPEWDFTLSGSGEKS